MIHFLENNLWDVYSEIITGIITVFGAYYAYRCNSRASGSNFIQKYLSIGWVIGIRWIVFILLPVTIVYFIVIGIYSGIPEQTTLSDVLFFNIAYTSYFLVLGKHIKDTVRKS